MFDRHRLFGGPWRDKPFQKGVLKYVILDLIKDKPRYGYEIIRALEERSHGFYTPSPGTIYPMLQMLEEMGYVTVVEQDGKKVYTITEGGRQFLSERKDLADGIKSQIRHCWNPQNIEDIAKTMGEFGKFRHFLGHRLRHLDPEKMQRIREIISRAHEEIEGIFEEREEGSPKDNNIRADDDK